MAVLYDYWGDRAVIGEAAPNMLVHPQMIPVAKSIRDSGITLVWYIIPQGVGADDVGNLLVLEQDVARTRLGYSGGSDVPITSETPIVRAVQGGIIFTQLNFINLGTIRNLCRFIINQLIDAVGVGYVDGVYIDALNAYCPPFDDNFRIPGSYRGPGTPYWTPSVRQVFDIVREECRLKNPVVYSEHANDIFAGDGDLFYDSHISNFSTLDGSIFSAVFMFSDYCRISTFSGFGSGPDLNISEVADFADRGELFSSVFSHYFHHGYICPFLTFFSGRNSYWIHYPGEQEYDDWWQDNEYFYQFLKQLYFTYSDVIKYYHTSEKVRETADSYIRRLIRGYVDSSFNPYIAQHKLQDSVWYDSDADVIAILLSNWSATGHNPNSLTFSETLFWDKYPDLGRSPRDVYVINLGTGDRTTLSAYNGKDPYTFDFDIEPGEAFLIEMTPSGVSQRPSTFIPDIGMGSFDQSNEFGSRTLQVDSTGDAILQITLSSGSRTMIRDLGVFSTSATSMALEIYDKQGGTLIAHVGVPSNGKYVKFPYRLFSQLGESIFMKTSNGTCRVNYKMEIV